MYKYQNVSDNEQVITRDGNISPRVVEPGATVITSVPLENPNFKYLGKVQNDTPNVTGVQVGQDNVVTDAEPVATNTKEDE